MTARKAERRRLFAAPPEEFTAVRDALVRELRAAGDKQEAEALKKLRKPPVALWIANQLARLAPADVEALVEATARLRHGQSAAVRGASGDELREAMRAQRDALAHLGDAAGRAALEAKTTLTLALQRRVQNTVQAAAASEPEALREGVLESELQPAGFEELFAAAPSPPAAQHPALKHAALPATGDNGAAAARARKAEEARARKQEEAAARAREQELRKAEQEAQRLDDHARKLEEAATRSEAEAARARREAGDARREASEAAARASKLRS
jgi:hypothetical protein